MDDYNNIVDLASALHRKLLNINSEIRLLRKKKFYSQSDLNELILKRKRIDSTYSATKKLLVRYRLNEDYSELYTQYLNVYKLT